MKLLVSFKFALLLIFFRESTGCTVQCPEKSDDEISYLPSPTDCSKYYVCVEAEPIEMSCPEGLWFDSELNICNFPQNVTCDNSKYLHYSFLKMACFKCNIIIICSPLAYILHKSIFVYYSSLSVNM